MLKALRIAPVHQYKLSAALRIGLGITRNYLPFSKMPLRVCGYGTQATQLHLVLPTYVINVTPKSLRRKSAAAMVPPI